MSKLASDVMDRVRACLNDVNVDLFSNAVLLPYLKIANDDLADELVDNGSTVNKEVATDFTVAAGVGSIASPADMIVPIELFEKDTGALDSSFKLVTQKGFLPNVDNNSSSIGIWAWREQTVVFCKSSLSKVLRLRYYRIITEITSDGTIIELPFSLNYLAHHTAALAAEYIGQNSNKAAILEDQANQKLNKILKREVKQNQSGPVRRKAFTLKSSRRHR